MGFSRRCHYGHLQHVRQPRGSKRASGTRHAGHPPVRPPDRTRPRRQAVVKVAKLQETMVVALPANGESLLFALDDPVLPGRPRSMAFGDHRWDLSILGLAANQVAGHAVLNFDRFLKPVVLGGSDGLSEQVRLSPIWLLRAKEVIAILLAPTRHTSRGRLDVYRVRESSSSKL